MFEGYVNILALLKLVNEIWTRKKVQKIIFLLQQKGAPFNENFSLHYYGPYSPELQIELDQLNEAKLIDQSLRGDSYVFSYRDSADRLLEKNKALNELIESDFSDLINSLNSLQPRLLEMMATIVFFEKSYGKDKDKLKVVLGGIKPRLIDFFEDAWIQLDKLDLHFSG